MTRSRMLTFGLPLICIAAVACLPLPTATAASAGAPPATAPPASIPLVQARQSDQLVQMMGVNIHLLDGRSPYADFPKVLRELETLGVRHVRTDFAPTRRDLAAKLVELGAAGIHTDLVMNQSAATLDLPARVAAMAALPAGTVDAVEPANEWNLFGPANWAAQDRAFQRQLWTLVRHRPTLNAIKVLGPSLGMRTGYPELGDLSRYLDDGNIHLYPGGAPPNSRVDDLLLRERSVAQEKPVEVTEAGYHNALYCHCLHPPITEKFAAVYEPRLFLDYFRHPNVKRVYQYELYDSARGTILNHFYGRFGLLHYDSSPKPSFGAMRNLIGLAADPGRNFTPGRLAVAVHSGGTPLRKVLLERRDGTFTLFLWRDVSVWDQRDQRAIAVHPRPATVDFGQPVASAAVYQPTSGAAPISKVSDPTSVTVPLGGQVVAVRITLP